MRQRGSSLPIGMLSICCLCNATLPSMDTVTLLSLFIPHHVAACVRPYAAAWTRLSSGGNSSPQTARPVAFPAKWSPGSSLDLWCKSFYLFHSVSSVLALCIDKRSLQVVAGCVICVAINAGATRFASSRNFV